MNSNIPPNLNFTIESTTHSGGSDDGTVFYNTGGYPGLTVFIDVTSVSGTGPSITFALKEKDPVSESWAPVGTFSAVTSTQLKGGWFHPAITPSSGAIFSALLTRNLRFSWSVSGTAPAFVFTIGGCWSA